MFRTARRTIRISMAYSPFKAFLNSNSFAYAAALDGERFCYPRRKVPTPPFAFFGAPNITVAISQDRARDCHQSCHPAPLPSPMPTPTGVNGPQINLLNSLDQSISSITFRSGNGNTSRTPRMHGFLHHLCQCLRNCWELLQSLSQPYSNLLGLL